MKPLILTDGQKASVLRQMMGAPVSLEVTLDQATAAIDAPVIPPVIVVVPPVVEPDFVGGYLDRVTAEGVCSGWASKSGSLVSVLVDDVEVGTVRSNQPRPDVEATGLDANTGWQFQLPATVGATKIHNITAKVGTQLLKGGAKGYGTSADPVDTSFARFTADMSSDASIQRDFAHAAVFFGTSPTVDVPSKYVNGLLEVPIIPGLNAGPGIGGTGCSWHHWLNTAVNELWCEYDFVIGTDVPAGFNEEGCKLPGLGGMWEQADEWNAPGTATSGGWSARLWHRRPNADGLCELAAYVYSQRSADAGNPFGEVIPTGKLLVPSVKYKLGQHIKLNTQAASGAWNSDGIFEILLNGVVVFSDTAFKMRGDQRALFQDFFVNIFHGGSVPPKAPIHYYIGGIIVDNKPITAPVVADKPPVIVMGGVPDWRRGRKVGEWGPIPGTEHIKLGLGSTLPDGSYSGTFNDRVNSTMSSGLAAGHMVSDDNWWTRIDLMKDSPVWEILRQSNGGRAPTASQSYFPDGRPTGSHIYYVGQVPQVRGKPLYVRAVNLAPSYTGEAPDWRTDVFDPETNDYVLGGYPGPQRKYNENSCALDLRDGSIYLGDQGGMLAKLNTDTMKWAYLSSSFSEGGWRGMVVDPAIDSLLYGISGGALQAYNFLTGAVTTRALTWIGDANDTSKPPRSVVIQERNRCLYTVDGRETTPAFFNKIDLRTGAIQNIGTVPQPCHIYNRIEDFPALGGIVHFPHSTMPLQFFPTE